MTSIPALETERLIIRPFAVEDLEAIHHALCAAWDVPGHEPAKQFPERETWLRWTVAGYEELARLRQPPYGDRAIVQKLDGQLVGSVGLVPSLGPFGQLPGFPTNQGSRRFYPEVGLFWVVDPAYQGQGYATEAGQVLIDFAFQRLNLGRLVATTERTNERSMAVMRKLGMRVLQNPEPNPEWFQVVGLLERS
jgi:RimJ/RimL family protein N-acetyltransferase